MEVHPEPFIVKWSFSRAFLNSFSCFSCVCLFARRRLCSGAAGVVPEETSAVLCCLWFHGHSVRPEDERIQALNPQWACRLCHSQPRIPHRTGLPRGRQNGEWKSHLNMHHLSGDRIHTFSVNCIIWLWISIISQKVRLLTMDMKSGLNLFMYRNTTSQNFGVGKIFFERWF